MKRLITKENIITIHVDEVRFVLSVRLEHLNKDGHKVEVGLQICREKVTYDNEEKTKCQLEYNIESGISWMNRALEKALQKGSYTKGKDETVYFKEGTSLEDIKLIPVKEDQKIIITAQ